MCDDDKEWLDMEIDSAKELARERAGADVLRALFSRLETLESDEHTGEGLAQAVSVSDRRDGFEQAILTAGREFYPLELEGLSDESALAALRKECKATPGGEGRG